MAKNKSSRCPCCKKKLPIITFTCKCGEIFCIKCKLPEKHNCQFNYKKEGISMLEKENAIIVASKVEQI